MASTPIADNQRQSREMFDTEQWLGDAVDRLAELKLSPAEHQREIDELGSWVPPIDPAWDFLPLQDRPQLPLQVPKQVWKKRRREAPVTAPEGVRALALARRLYTGKNMNGEIVCCLPKLLNPPTSPQAWELLWTAIGRKLAEKEPEFSRGSGRTPGAKNKKSPVDTPENMALRRYRDNLARKRRTIPGEDIILEDGVSLDPVWKR